MVDNNRRTKLFVKIAIGQVMVGLLITALALFVLSYAEGNRFNFKRMKFIKTGVIQIQYLPKDSEIFVNNKKAKTSKSFVRNITPATYSFRVEKDGYTPWQANLKIEPESVNVYKDVILFKKDPKISSLTDERKISYLKGPNEELAYARPNGLYSNGYEIWVRNSVVARFSTHIDQVSWYTDEAHVVYKQGKEIRIMEKNGQNDTLLVTLANPLEVVKFAVSSDGQELYFIDGSEYKVAEIR